MQHAETRFIGLLGALYQRYQRESYARLAASGHPAIRPAHSPIFRHIDEEDGSRMVDIAAKAGITKQSIAYLVKDLRETGYLRVAPDPDDGRAQRIMLTDKGCEVAAELPRISRAIEAEAAGSLGRSDLEDVKAMLRRLLD